MFGFMIAQYYGAKDKQKETQTIKTILFLTTSFSFIILIIIYTAGKPILEAMFDDRTKYSQELINKSYNYLRIIS
jgi:Na+-driven multidrug efflux pump